MKKYFFTAALAMTLLGTAAQAQMVGRKVDEDSQKSDSKPAKGHVTPAVGVALNAAQKALQAKDAATAMTEIKAAQAVPDRTPFDDAIGLARAAAQAAGGDASVCDGREGVELAIELPVLPVQSSSSS